MTEPAESRMQKADADDALQVVKRFDSRGADNFIFDLFGEMILDRLALPLEVLKRGRQKATSPRGRVENSLAQLGIGDGDYETHDGTRSVELASVACSVAHLLEHGLVQHTEGVDFVA